METNEVNVNEVEKSTENIQVENNGFVIPESFRAKYAENPDLAIEDLYKAQHKIVQQKKAQKEQSSESTTWMSRDQLEKFYEEKKFFETNPDLTDYREQLNEFTSKWLSFDDAKALLERKDPTIANRKIANKTNFTSWVASNWPVTFSRQQLEDMSLEEYKKAKTMIKDGKATFIN